MHLCFCVNGAVFNRTEHNTRLTSLERILGVCIKIKVTSYRIKTPFVCHRDPLIVHLTLTEILQFCTCTSFVIVAEYKDMLQPMKTTLLVSTTEMIMMFLLSCLASV